MKTFLLVFGVAAPVFAQYGGPAILSRGEAPAALNGPQISFRPFLDVSAVYSTGLSAITLDSAGNIANQASAGVQVGIGVSGSHAWRHTQLGMSYRGSYSYYTRNSRYSNFNQSALIGVKHQLSRHISMSVNESIGMFNRDAGLLSSISPSVPFDPAQTYIPTTDYFNNRTLFLSTQASLAIQTSTRMSYSFGGGIFLTSRASQALYGVAGENAIADVEYRKSKRMTIGAMYGYSHFGFARISSGTDVNTAAVVLSFQLNRFWEMSGFAGFGRMETKFIQNVAVDPAIAAIIGITESTQVKYSVRYVPNMQARVSRVFHKGVLYFNAGHIITPGNGLFLTSTATNLGLGYTYTGLRKWSFGTNGIYQRAQSVGNVIGDYQGTSVALTMGRQFVKNLNFTSSVNLHKYGSNAFGKYNATVYSATLGIGWSPGDVPLRFW